jgi:hypothetical protein
VPTTPAHHVLHKIPCEFVVDPLPNRYLSHPQQPFGAAASSSKGSLAHIDMALRAASRTPYQNNQVKVVQIWLFWVLSDSLWWCTESLPTEPRQTETWDGSPLECSRCIYSSSTSKHESTHSAAPAPDRASTTCCSGSSESSRYNMPHRSAPSPASTQDYFHPPPPSQPLLHSISSASIYEQDVSHCIYAIVAEGLPDTLRAIFMMLVVCVGKT